jgi:hypothetical protein
LHASSTVRGLRYIALRAPFADPDRYNSFVR